MPAPTSFAVETLRKLSARARQDFSDPKIPDSKGSFFTIYKSSEPHIRIEVQFQSEKGQVIHVGILSNGPTAAVNELNANKLKPFMAELLRRNVIRLTPTPKNRNVQYFAEIPVSPTGITQSEIDTVSSVSLACFDVVRAFEKAINGF